MPFKPIKYDETLTPAKWPAPDYTKWAEVSHAWLPDGEDVGDLVIQDESKLVWLSVVGPGKPAAYAARVIVQDILRSALAANKTAREANSEARAAILFRAPEIVNLPELMSKLQKEWN